MNLNVWFASYSEGEISMSISKLRAGGLQVVMMLFGVALASSAAHSNAADRAPLPGGLSAPSTPTRAPSFNLQTAAGGTLRSDELRGKVVIARFWATW
jgi:hypothetical protein